MLRMLLNVILNMKEGQDDWLKKFSGLNLTVLQLASDKLGCQPLPSDEHKVTFCQVDYAQGLLSWVCHPLLYINITLDELSSINLRQIDIMKCGHVLTKSEMDEICSNIINMQWPSWLTSVLSEFGSASYGKLKADQWHVLGTTFLPVSLVHLWSDALDNLIVSPDQHENQEANSDTNPSPNPPAFHPLTLSTGPPKKKKQEFDAARPAPESLVLKLGPSEKQEPDTAAKPAPDVTPPQDLSTPQLTFNSAVQHNSSQSPTP